MNRLAMSSEDLAAFASGMLDVLFAFSLALERKGLLLRSEVVELLDQVQEQVDEREGCPTPRRAVATLMLQAFALPLAGDRSGFQVIVGGKSPAA